MSRPSEQERLARQRAEAKAETDRRFRITIASRILATERCLRVVDDGDDVEGNGRLACRNALRLADWLIEEGSK